MAYYRCGGGEKGFYPSILVTGIPQEDTVYAVKDGKRYASKWVDKGAEILPAEYQEVEYIQSTGTQYIDTGIVPNSNTRVTCSVSGINSGANGSIFESYSSASDEYGIVNSTYYPTFRSDYGSSEVNQNIALNPTTVYNIDKNKNVCTINEFTITNSTQTFSGTNSLYVFARHQPNSGTLNHPGFKLHEMKIYTDGVNIVRNFIPCYRKSDNVAGLYDTVNGIFYTNAGSGSFIVGSNVSHVTQGHLIEKLPTLGMYTVTATNGTQTAMREVFVDMVTDYVVEMEYIPKEGLIAQYLFDGDYNDSSGNGYNLISHSVSIQECMLRRFEYCAAFNGSAYLEASNKVIPTTKPFSISLWVKTTLSSRQMIIGNTSAGSEHGSLLEINREKADTVRLAIHKGSEPPALDLTSDFSVTDGQFHHYAVTWTGDTTDNGAKIYIDGELKNSGRSASVLSDNTRNLTIGKAPNSNSYYLNGQIAGIRIYDRELSSSEISTLWLE